jgi:signal transduction histidine kinase
MTKEYQLPESINSKLDKYFNLLTGTASWKESLEELFLLVREDFIFDNLVIYQTESHALEVLYAKSTGRGKSAEADASWGESIANHIVHDLQMICEEPEIVGEINRLESPFLLGIPIFPATDLPGAIIFIRFGGPNYSAQDKKYAQYAAHLATTIVRRKMLDEFMAKVEEVQAMSKLQSDFINTISHELRSPLGFIKGYTTTLLRPDTNWDAETQKDFLEIIERETNNLTDLIEDLLDSSRLQSGQMKFDFHQVRLDSIIRDEVNRIHLTNPQLKIVLDFEPEIPVIDGDSRKLAQVVDNLLSNEIKYAPDSLVQVKLRKDHDHLQLEFTDDGPGIPDAYQSKIFTRFFRVPESSMKAHGSGLGLFICKQILDSHEGSISVTSSQNGTTFKILLPLEQSKKQIEIKERP